MNLRLLYQGQRLDLLVRFRKSFDALFNKKVIKYTILIFLCCYIPPRFETRSLREQSLDLRSKFRSLFVEPEQLVSIALPEAILLSQESELSRASQEIIEVISDDIKFAGIAKVVDRSLYPNIQKNSSKTDFSLWRKPPLSLNFLIQLYLSSTSQHLKVSMQVVNIHSEKIVLNKSYQGHKEKIRALSHLIANDLIKAIANINGIAHSKIAFISPPLGARDIFQMDYDGKNVQRLTYEHAIILFPTLSPVTKKLAYITLTQKGPLLQIRSTANGLLLGSLSFPRGSISSPSFSPDENFITFASSKDSHSMQLYTINLQTNQINQITDKSSAIHTSPRWNPQNGREIAFISDESGTPQIHIIDVDQKKQRRLLQNGGSADSPAWSPNGQYIAFCWKPERSPRFDIFVMDITSGEIVQLTSNAGNNERPSWSPDGRYLAFQSDRTGRFEIYTMRIDGTNQRQLTTQGAISPIWFE
ncbi:MAG: hypothetical protein RMM98_12315 [Acidobacteriota bacterium]|nr:hypothetical protein [Blastocatellia bacterium]MDW8240394.1 hypothetical protein [Acidobacteriota bacterium]